jgi:Coenzyme PQQ synthesis protein D (PqqD)
MGEARPTRSFDVRVNSVRGSTILTLGTRVYELRDVESMIWNLCDGEHSTAEIAAEIVATFDVEQQIALTDVEEFVDDLRQENLIEVDAA